MEDQSQKVMTISQAANLSRVSVRTLQYYDQIGLLKPAAVSESGYRLYTQAVSYTHLDVYKRQVWA